MNRLEKIRLAMMIMNTANTKPETVEETLAIIEKIIKRLKLNDNNN
jgi:hypothetical protein|tara:strand:- start:6746 stop:6883 length:138 start_codon:yes stop_codon:yes gene_type:complete